MERSITREALKNLIGRREEHCISIFMPTLKGGEAAKQNPIRFKNMLAKAHEQLVAGGMRSPEALKILQPAHKLLEDHLFWQYQADGMAVFLSRKFARLYNLPLKPGELVVCADHFHIKPLLPVFSYDGRFYVLGLSQNEVRLFECTRYSEREINLEGIPRSVSEMLRAKFLEKQPQAHLRSGNGRIGGKSGAVIHGESSPSEAAKNNILRYFQRVNRGLSELLKTEHHPLILAGVDFLFSIYRQANTYPHLAAKGVSGSFKELKAEELRKRGWEVAGPIFAETMSWELKQYTRLSGTERVSDDIKTILPAAHSGKVAVLFTASDVRKWGNYDPGSRTLSLHDTRRPEDDDLLDTASIHTLINGGKVFALEQKDIPGASPLAAVFRY